MSRINSMFKQATQSVKHATHEVKQQVAKQEDKTRTAVTRGMTDGFEGGVSKLYDPGAKKPGRTTVEQTVTRGLDEQLGDARNSQHVVSGLQARLFAQRAGSVVSAGGDVFLGGKEHTVSTDDFTGVRTETTIKLGAEARAAVFAGTVNGVQAGVQAGFELTERKTGRGDVGHGLQLEHAQTINLLYGAVAKGGAQLGTVTGAQLEVFVGAKGVGEQRVAITDGTTERGALAGRFGTMVGVGVLAHAEAGYDVDNQQLRVSGDVGAALGIGAQIGGDVTLGGRDE